MPLSLSFFPGELLPDSETICSIRSMRSNGQWAIEDIAYYNRVSVKAVRLLSDDCASLVDESKLELLLTAA